MKILPTIYDVQKLLALTDRRFIAKADGDVVNGFLHVDADVPYVELHSTDGETVYFGSKVVLVSENEIFLADHPDFVYPENYVPVSLEAFALTFHQVDEVVTHEESSTTVNGVVVESGGSSVTSYVERQLNLEDI